LEIWGNDNDIIGTVSRTLTNGVTYIFKARVETVSGIGGLYSFKVWEEGQPEPPGWDLTAQEQMSDPQNGSITLISHHVDVSFGDVTVTTVPLTISDVQVTLGAGDTEATITWTTDVPATSSVAYGPTSAYENGSVSDPNLVTEHSITLTDLTPDALYHYLVTSVDGSGNPASTADRTFVTTSSSITSDDFSSPTLDTDLWTFVDPLSDATLAMTGINTQDAWVNISVPAGTEHELWTGGILAPHLLQSANDTDFEIEVKFESQLSQQFQEQGILVKEDDENFMRFEFYSDDSQTNLYAASFIDLAPTTQVNSAITDGTPLYMRVGRAGDQWTLSYSYDGETWTTGVSFNHSLTVTGVGPYAGNGVGGSSPAHTGSIDYFFNTASPIVPEDPTVPLNISDIQATPGDTEAVITWVTDVPADSSVAYGPTSAYEDGSVWRSLPG
jgi:regulation of enolase protein 1 (concanavalin A-like superfamily)